MKRTGTFQQKERGTLLIVAMLLCAMIGISLGSYLQMSRTALTISNRALYNNAAMNLAEQGIEEAMYAVNQLVDNPSYPMTGWTKNGINAYREFGPYTLSQNATGTFRVYIYDFAGVSAPKLVSWGRVTLGNKGAPIEKWVEVTLRKTSKFANGLVAKNSILFRGNNATVDSWNSEKDTSVSPATTRATPVPFASAYRNANGSVGSISIATDAVVVQNADVWGYVSNNSGSDLHPPEEFVGANGSILGPESPVGSSVDPARTSTTFSATMDAPSVPTEVGLSNLGNINTTGFSLPIAGDIPNGTVGTEWEGYCIYDATKIDLNNKYISITGKVVLRLSNTASSVDLTGGDAEIRIGATGYLALFAPGNVTIAGKGVTNGVDGPDADSDVDETSELGQPKQFQVYGTSTTTQTISFAGSGLFSGVVYAPNANVSIVGNGAVCGSVVAGTIDLSGNAQFHYDESLADMGADAPFRIAKWKELTTATDRNAYSSVLTW
jgi:hypothetical protein